MAHMARSLRQDFDAVTNQPNLISSVTHYPTYAELTDRVAELERDLAQAQDDLAQAREMDVEAQLIVMYMSTTSQAFWPRELENRAKVFLEKRQ